MLDRAEILRRIREMDPNEAAMAVRKALEESGIPYTTDRHEIVFSGLNRREETRVFPIPATLCPAESDLPVSFQIEDVIPAA